jgi:3-methyladenine DNA glycosylase AlkD
MLAEAADPLKAAPMAAYMKTEMPFYGVQKNGRLPVVRAACVGFPPSSEAEYSDAVRALWTLRHREEKYIALAYARSFDEYVGPVTVPLFRRLIIEGAWWDFVDEIATKLVGRALEKSRREVTPTIRLWVRDENLWIRRTSIICQLGHKEGTDTALLNDACVGNLGDTDFFIRKAIGWALREQAKTDPEWVRAFITDYRDELSALSYREATKHL